MRQMSRLREFRKCFQLKFLLQKCFHTPIGLGYLKMPSTLVMPLFFSLNSDLEVFFDRL